VETIRQQRKTATQEYLGKRSAENFRYRLQLEDVEAAAQDSYEWRQLVCVYAPRHK